MAAYTIVEKTADYTAVSGDLGKIIDFTANSSTLSLTAAATLGAGWYVWIKNSTTQTSGDHEITIDPNGSETIETSATRKLYRGQSMLLVCDGSNFFTISGGVHGIAINSEAHGSSSAWPQAGGDEAIAIGYGSTAAQPYGVAMGWQANAQGNKGVALGYQAYGSHSAVAIGYQAEAHTDNIAIGNNAETSSSGERETSIGSTSRTAGTDSIALGRSNASAAGSIALGIQTNSSSYGASGANSLSIGLNTKASSNYDTAIGYKAIASGYGSLAIGTAGNSASGPTASGPGSIAIGNDVQATTHYCFGIGTDINVSHQFSYAIGDKLVTRAKGQFVYGTGRFAADGDAQGSQYIIKCATTDATPTTMVTDSESSGAADNQIVAATDTCITFSGTIVAMQNGAQSYGSWEIRGLLVNDGGTTTLPVSNVSEIGSSGWKVSLRTDNTNNALTVKVTGEASHNIRWVANIQTAEVTYA